MLLFMLCFAAPTHAALYSCDYSLRGINQECTFTYNGVTQIILLYVPYNYQPGNALLFNYSGVPCSPETDPPDPSGQTCGESAENTSQLIATSDQDGFAVIFPDPVRHSDPNLDLTHWVCNGAYDEDCGYARFLIGQVQAGLGTDPNQVYLTGFSGGAFMTAQGGAWLSDIVAAIGVVEGSLYYPATSPPVFLQSPVSVIEFEGSYDGNFPMCGIWYPDSPIDAGHVLPSQDQNFDFWAQANGCQSATAATLCTGGQTTLPVGVNGYQTGVLERDGINCNGNADVRFYVLPTGIHQWYPNPVSGYPADPNATPPNPAFALSDSTNSLIWNFFSQHRKDQLLCSVPERKY